MYISLAFLTYTRTDVRLLLFLLLFCLQLREEEALSSLHEAVDIVLANIMGDLQSVQATC